MTTVVDKCVNSLLQHSLFVSYDNVRSFKLEHSLKTVISVDNTSVKVVKVTGCISAAVEHDHRSEVRRDNRNNVEYHPLRTVARNSECLNDLKPFEQLYSLLTRRQVFKLLFQLVSELVKVYLAQQLLDSLCAHTSLELILVVLFEHLAVVLFGEQLTFYKLSVARIYNDILCEVKNFFKSFLGNFKHLTDS